jgi:L-asparaginase
MVQGEARRKKILVLNVYSNQAKMTGIEEGDDKHNISNFDELHGHDAMPHVVVYEPAAAVHEADSSHAYYTFLVNTIAAEYERYDGFLIVQQIHTMVNTACILSFMLENLGKPVVLTGSVNPLSSPHSDYRRNFILAAIMAGGEDCCEVVIVFAEKVFRGNRAQLMTTSRLQPFDSPQFPLLASMQGTHVIAEHRRFRPAPTGRLQAHGHMEIANVLTITVTPSVRPDAVMALLRASDAKGLVIVAFGAGNVPVRNPAILELARAADERGMLVVVCSQVRHATVRLGVYYTSNALSKVAISSQDMTLEATIAKLKYLFGCGYDRDRMKQLMAQNLRGELSVHDDVASSKL